MFCRLVFVFFLAMPCAVSAAEHGPIQVTNAYAFETPKTAMAGAGYLTLQNSGETADRLIAVQADFPQVMIHTTEEKEGVTRMMHVDAVDIAAGSTVTFAPGSLHVMFMGLAGDPFEVGEEVPTVLVFEQAGEVDVVFKVVARD